MLGEAIGNYLVTAKLGEGGMGAVYLAVHRVIGRKVAVKVLRPGGSADAELLHRFFLEARSTASLRHPALIEVFDFGTNRDGSPYIIMEYVDGESLAARIQRVGRLPMATVLDVSQQIAAGMSVAHGAGIVHRDLKPGNVLLCGARSGQQGDIVKILDFGIAKLMSPDPLVGPITQMSAFMGTPLYMAPEQCLGAGNVDHRADIYALGCMMYEMTCGEPPFVSPDLRALISAQLGGKPVPPRTHRPEIPPELESIVLKALSKNPESRQSHMSEVALALDACAKMSASPQEPVYSSRHDCSSVGSFGPVAKPASDPPPSRDDPGKSPAGDATPRPRRRSTWLSAASAALVLTAAATAWVLRQSPAARSDSQPVAAPAASTPLVSAAEPSPKSGDPVAGSAIAIAVDAAAPRASVEIAAGSTPRPPPAKPSRPNSRAPGTQPSARAPAAKPPSLGGEEIENPWPQGQ
jgi:serine/threonine protein kinase